MVLPAQVQSAFLSSGLFEKSPQRPFADAQLARDQMHTKFPFFGPADVLYALVEGTHPRLALLQLRKQPSSEHITLRHNLYVGKTELTATGPVVTSAVQIRRLNDKRYPSTSVPFPNPDADRSLLHIPGFGFVALQKTKSTAHYGSYVLVAEQTDLDIPPGTVLAGPFQTIIQGAAVLSLVENAAFQFINTPLELGRKEIIKRQLAPGQIIKVVQVDIDPPVDATKNRNRIIEPDFETHFEIEVTGAPELNAKIPNKNVSRATTLSSAIDPRAVPVLLRLGQSFGMQDHKTGDYLVVTWPAGVLIKDSRSCTVFIPRDSSVTKPKNINDGLQFDQARILMLAD